ncbi:MAG: hypothetical protein NTY33_01325 [Candidatus Moranbacteria bacterium]|nr:hypothetical protein [Candidatus Moranbacteria bacterium]
MDDELPSKGIGKPNIRGKMTLILAMGLFFSVYFQENSTLATSVKADLEVMPDASINSIDAIYEPSLLKFDPMEKVKNSVEKIELEKQKEQQEKSAQERKDTEPKNDQEQKYQDLVSGSPLEEMLPFIAKCDNETASFLIAIAKKESDFGKYAPQKDGRDCFNYWGYRGTYNQTDSGYSCFDSPEQAIAMVGERIRELLDKKIDTAEKMVVWKCGSSCAGHDPAGVRKWISDVALYYGKANS